MDQTYSLGAIVRAKSRFQGRMTSGRYQVVGLIARTDQVLYRIRRVDNGVEWVVAHDGIEFVSAAPENAAR